MTTKGVKSVTKSPAQFLREVKAELHKIIWPTRREAVTATLVVFIMAAIVSIFFLFVDHIISWVISMILG